MDLMTPIKLLLPALLLCTLPVASQAQNEGLLPTQTLVRAESKMNVIPDATAITLQLDGKSAHLSSLTAVQPSGVQIALLIDDGLSRSAGVQLDDLRDFARNLPPGTELLVGYMTNGHIQVEQPFTTDHAGALEKIRLPMGMPGQSASPYFCLSDFVKRWPGATEGDASRNKARFVMMITNGVDPYNGSTSVMNQDSPYVQTAIIDAQRAGVSVSSIYYRDAGYRGNSASFSGQSYLKQLADATGGDSYYEGTGSPVSLKPYLKEFQHGISETYVATFQAPAGGGGRQRLIRLKMNTSTPKLKLHHPEEVRPGNIEASQ
jgi:hypothetical protein